MYAGPKRIVIVGGGLAGLAAFDALTESLASVPVLPQGLSVTLVESVEHGLGGRAISAPVMGPSERHPFAPFDVSSPHGIHFLWGSYDHTYRLLGRALASRAVPQPGTETYCLWLTPPDIPGDATTGSRIVAFHVCNPKEPELALRPQVRRILRMFERRSMGAPVFERVVSRALGFRIATHDLLSYLDILFDEANIGAELRWTMFLVGAFTATMGAPETNGLLRLLLGRAPQDVEIGEVVRPLFGDWTRAKLSSLAERIERSPLFRPGRGPGAVVPDAGPPSGWWATWLEDAQALADFAGLVRRDLARVLMRAGTYDPRQSGYVKNILKAAFSSPYGLDVATAIRDAQFGIRDHAGARVQLFDGDDSRSLWEAVAARAQARGGAHGFVAEIKRPRVVSRIELDEGRARVVRVHLAETADHAPPDVPTLRPARPGPVVEQLDAEVVLVTTMPACIVPMLPEGPSVLLRQLEELARFANDTINLQLFLPRRIELPFPAEPSTTTEHRAFSISNLEGPFTILVDLRRGWSTTSFRRIRLDAQSPPDAFDGTAWELVGNYADLYTHDPLAHRARYQWPLAAQQRLADLLQDPTVLDPSLRDTRRWVHDVGAPGRLTQVPLGEVVPDQRTSYQQRWTEQAGPIIVAETLRQIASMPGMQMADRDALNDQAQRIARGDAHEVKWILVRNAHAEQRFFSAEPSSFGLRPHARFPTSVEGLWFAGDWTRNGLNVQAMESAVISGLQAASGILETLRAAGLPIRTLPRVDPSVLPPGAWDSGVV